MKFKYEFMSLTQIGEVFGVSSHQAGRWLADLGLRYESAKGMKPSREAFEGGFVKVAPSRGQGYTWAWHGEKTVKALEDADHKTCIPPGHELLAECILNGPFRYQPSQKSVFEIINGDGSTAITVAGEKNAQFLCKLLNAAHNHGVINRLLGDEQRQVEAPVAQALAG